MRRRHGVAAVTSYSAAVLYIIVVVDVVFVELGHADRSPSEAAAAGRVRLVAGAR